jgi:DNA repair exonuclease SbcCD ATPase subunit
MRAEIEDLQTALAQRDAERFDVSSDQQTDAGRADEASDEVLQRMQELVDEANRSDERVAVLEEMLHASEDANRSEQEERHHLEAWVRDIEKRIGQREDEHVAEVEAMRQRLEESSEQIHRLQQQLRRAAQSGSAPKQYEETLENLQKSNQELQEQLAESQKQCFSLEQRLEEASDGQERALREERATVAKEQAKVSRLRHELSSKLAAIEEMPKSENQADKETAHRIQTLRQHLREIHEQEKLEQKDVSLATRLSKLWKRVDEY